MAKKPTPPASVEAGALRDGEFLPGNNGKTADSMTVYHGSEAQALPSQRLTIDRVDGEESILIDNTRYYKDLRIGKIAGFSRPRNIRATIKKMMKDSQFVDGSVICLDDEDGNQIYYLNQGAGMKALVGVRGVNEQMIMSMLGMYGANQDQVSSEKALAAYERTVVMWDRAKTKFARDALFPIVQRRARIAGFEPPSIDSTDTKPKDQPRLPGV